MRFLPASRRIILVLACGVALLLGGCANGDSDVDTSATTSTAPQAETEDDPAAGGISMANTFTKDQSGETVSLSPGEEAFASLETCPGCGYHWEITEPTDEAVVKFVGSEQSTGGNTGPAGEPIAGAPETEVFRFEAVATGSTSVTIGYLPPGQDAPEETFTLSFTVA